MSLVVLCVKYWLVLFKHGALKIAYIVGTWCVCVCWLPVTNNYNIAPTTSVPVNRFTKSLLFKLSIKRVASSAGTYGECAYGEVYHFHLSMFYVP